MSKLDNAPKIICITTEGADNRIGNFINQCSSLNISNYRIMKFKPYEEYGFTITGKYINNIHKNSKGPTTSHLLAIKNWLDSSEEDFVLIMEDDVSLETVQYWNFNFSDFINSLPQDWECVQLSCIRESFNNIEIKTRSRLNSDWGCQAYLLNRNYAKKLIKKYYVSNTHFNLDNFNVKVQIKPEEYGIYDLFPIVENILFEGVGVVYNMPLFIEDINNTNSNFAQSNDQIHINSHNHILNWWKNEGREKQILNINYKDLTTRFALDPENTNLNFDMAYEYEKAGHTASAFSHYLRCAERTEDINLSYESLIRGYYCFNSQKDRNFTSCHLLKQAISLLPKRPEAYFLLAKFNEKHKQWYECYTYVSIALNICDFSQIPLKIKTEYSGKQCLTLLKAISSTHWDKIDESRLLLNSLIDDSSSLNNEQISSVQHHLTEIEKKRQKHLKYYNYKYDSLKIKFSGAEKVKENHSQAYQDIFVLTATQGKRGGKYLEIGAGDPYFGNNTALLEKEYGWTGISVEIDSKLVDKFKANRNSNIIQDDATKLNYKKILDNLNMGTNFDYLQLDCEPPAKTFEVLLSIPFDKYRFGVITYEHDYYLDMTRSYRQKSRNYLQSLGYKLIIGNVSMDDSTPFEDWWINPDMIDCKIFKSVHNDNINNIENFLFN